MLLDYDGHPHHHHRLTLILGGSRGCSRALVRSEFAPRGCCSGLGLRLRGSASEFECDAISQQTRRIWDE